MCPPPSFRPSPSKGNVGTKVADILSAVSRCELPPAALRHLGITSTDARRLIDAKSLHFRFGREEEQDDSDDGIDDVGDAFERRWERRDRLETDRYLYEEPVMAQPEQY